MSGLIIGLSIGITVAIIAAVLITVLVLKHKKQKNTPVVAPISKVDYALKNVINAFNIKLTAEHFTDIGMRFNNVTDLKTNMMQFINIAFPNIDINEVNKILSDNGLNKTAQQIFDEHKNDDYVDYKSKFNIPMLMQENRFNLLTGTDEEIKKKILIYMIVQVAYITIVDPAAILTDGNFGYTKLPYTITLPDSSTATISQLLMYVNNDWETNDNMSIYIRTDLNSNIDFANAVENNPLLDKSCLTNKLCKFTESISGIINNMKKDVAGLEQDIHDYINLKFAIMLFKLNDTPITTEMQNKNKYYNNTTQGATERGKLYNLLK